MEGSSSDGGRHVDAERRAQLAEELAQVLGMVRQLEAHMGMQGGGGAAAAAGDPCRALVSSMRSSVDRSIQIARSCCVDARPQPAGAPESPPSADGSAGSDHGGGGGDSRCRGNAAGQCKRRKTQPKWSTQVRVSAVQDVGPLEDGFSWRKYGQKDILGAKYPRAYFRCTHRHTQGCHASKQVQRTDGDPLLFDLVYHGIHTCAQGARSDARRPGPAGSAEHPQPQPQPQPQNSSVLVGFKPSEAGSAASSVVRASPCFVSTATSECEVSFTGYGLGGGRMAGVRNVPDVEPVATANSLMGDMDFMLHLDADFLNNSGYF